jgi:ketosteroid isomerase-like protein
MATEDRGFAEALERVGAALAAMASGDPEPYIGCWAETEDATLFGAWGTIEKGPRRLAETFRWVGGRFKGGSLVPEDTVAFASGDLAYTVGFERGEVAVDDGPPRPMARSGSRTSTGASTGRGGWCTATRTTPRRTRGSTRPSDVTQTEDTTPSCSSAGHARRRWRQPRVPSVCVMPLGEPVAGHQLPASRH